MLPAADTQLVQIVDAALADATRRSLRTDGSSWLTCRPGCTPCCHGVFRISALDAERLHSGLHALTLTDAPRVHQIHIRALALADLLRPNFPGNPETGTLYPEQDAGPDSEADPTPWDTFADLPEADAPCPVLDPSTGRCDLYTSRPLTCRIFGPPVQNEFGLGVCELCYVNAPETTLLHGEMHLTHHALEATLNADLPPTETIIAWAVLPSPAR